MMSPSVAMIKSKIRLLIGMWTFYPIRQHVIASAFREAISGVDSLILLGDCFAKTRNDINLREKYGMILFGG